MIESERSRQRARPPFLTIGIPTWNRAARLLRQLSAVELMLSEEIEVLVCDNGSDDDTWALLEQQVQADRFALRCLRNGVNLGADVNYLRVIEAAAGDWLWLVGDDDAIDFGVLPFVLANLRITQCALMLLLDVDDGHNGESDSSEVIDGKAFLQQKHDPKNLLLQKVGRMVCRVDLAQACLRRAHAKGVGQLHAYVVVWGPLLLAHGMLVATLRLMEEPPEAPRWNLLRGHIGAWKTTLEAFPSHRQEAQARELRMRRNGLLGLAAQELALRNPLTREDFVWMIVHFDFAGRLLLLALVASFKLSPVLSLRILSRFRPQLARQIRAASQEPAPEY